MKNFNIFLTSVRFSGILSVVTLLSLTACSFKTEPSLNENIKSEAANTNTIEVNKVQFKSANMKLGKLEMKPFHHVIKAVGMFDVPPDNKVSVSSYFGGTVKQILLLPGEEVKKGQLLFTLENPDFIQIQQDFLSAKGQLMYLKSDYERQKNLVEDNVTSQKNFLKSEADYTVTQVMVESLSKKLMLMNINPNALTLENIKTSIEVNSPTNGYVTEISISRGSFLSPSLSAITIVDPSHLHLELAIFEKDFPNVKIGQPIEFRIQQDMTKNHEAFVHLINRTIDPNSRTIGVHGHLKDDSLSTQFTPGMYVEAEIFTSSVSKTSLPDGAIVEDEGKFFVLILKEVLEDGYSFVRKQIRVGESNNGFIEILEPNEFDNDEEFLVNGAFNLISE